MHVELREPGTPARHFHDRRVGELRAPKHVEPREPGTPARHFHDRRVVEPPAPTHVKHRKLGTVARHFHDRRVGELRALRHAEVREPGTPSCHLRDRRVSKRRAPTHGEQRKPGTHLHQLLDPIVPDPAARHHADLSQVLTPGCHRHQRNVGEVLARIHVDLHDLTFTTLDCFEPKLLNNHISVSSHTESGSSIPNLSLNQSLCVFARDRRLETHIHFCDSTLAL